MHRRALVCAPLLPEYDREGGSRRLNDFIEFLVDAGWAVTFICENVADGHRYMHRLQQKGVATYAGFGPETESMIATGDFDLAILAFWHLARARAGTIRRLSPATRIIVESVDLHWLRNARRILGGTDGRLDRQFADQMAGELNAYADADAVFTVSQKEADLVSDTTGRPGHALAVPDCEAIPASPQKLPERNGLVFIGNFRHPPNVDAVEFLCDEVVPLLPPSLLRDHPVRIVGNSLDDRIVKLAARHAGVIPVGWVPSVEPYLHSALVSIVPLRYGAGTKRKLLQAMMAGTPSVSTTMGVEGLDLEPGRHVLLADDAATFADAILRLVEDPRLWRRMSVAGRERILERHGRESARRRFTEAVDAVLDRPRRGSDNAKRADRRETQLGQVRKAVDSTLPADARALVISRGDDALLDLGGRTGYHFPADRSGGWTGFHPRDSDDALQRLRSARRKADYLVIPDTSRWWLDHYTGFAEYLSSHCRRLWHDESCTIFELRRNGASAAANGRGRKRIRRAG